MKWKEEKKYEVGDTKESNIFPILPTLIGGYWYWLEIVKVKKELSLEHDGNNYYYNIWKNVYVINKK